MKTVNLNSVTLKKNGTPIELMGVTDKDDWEFITRIDITERVASSLRINLPKKFKDIFVVYHAEPTESTNSLFVTYYDDSVITTQGYVINGLSTSSVHGYIDCEKIANKYSLSSSTYNGNVRNCSDLQKTYEGNLINLLAFQGNTTNGFIESGSWFEIYAR